MASPSIFEHNHQNDEGEKNKKYTPKSSPPLEFTVLGSKRSHSLSLSLSHTHRLTLTHTHAKQNKTHATINRLQTVCAPAKTFRAAQTSKQCGFGFLRLTRRQDEDEEDERKEQRGEEEKKRQRKRRRRRPRRSSSSSSECVRACVRVRQPQVQKCAGD